MSQIWPDIPEWEGIPEVLRSGIWTQAYMLALRRGITWVLGLLSLAVALGGCGTVAYRGAGLLGCALGFVVGLAIGLMFFVRVVLERETRRLLPEVKAAAGWNLAANPLASQRAEPRRSWQE